MPDTPIMDHILSCVVTSRRMVHTITIAKIAPYCPVKVAVWVKNPGPMADVAIRNAAPKSAVILFEELFFFSDITISFRVKTGF